MRGLVGILTAAVLMTGLTALSSGQAGAALTMAMVALLLYRSARLVGGRKLAIHTHGGHDTELAARHEGGHVALAKAAGGQVVSARIYPDGSGVTYVRLPANATAVDEIAVCVAGEVAARSRSGCGGDQDNMRAVLAALPPDERSAARSAGYARADSVINGLFSDGGASSAAEKLLRDGRL